MSPHGNTHLVAYRAPAPTPSVPCSGLGLLPPPYREPVCFLLLVGGPDRSPSIPV
jgi:hypothetical protein